MKIPAILTLALAFTLGASSCTSTSAAVDRMNEKFLVLDEKIQAQEQALRDAAEVLASPIATPEQVDAAVAGVQAKVRDVSQAVQETKGALMDVRDAAKADSEQIKARLGEIAQGGISVGEVAAGGSGVSVLISAALWFLRDWRKRKGNDPILAQVEAKLAQAGNLSTTALERLADLLAERPSTSGLAGKEPYPPIPPPSVT